MLPALRAMPDLAAHPDPLSVTVHFLRPAMGDHDAEVTARVVRAGRSTTNATATLAQDGTARLVAHAVLGDLTKPARGAAPDPGLAPAPPDLPPPDGCVDRAELVQGVDLPILSRRRGAHPARAGRARRVRAGRRRGMDPARRRHAT